MAAFFGTFRYDRIFGPAYWVCGYMPTAFHSFYTLHSSYVAPSTPSTPSQARLARYSYLYFLISPLSPSLWVQRPKQKLIVREGNPNDQCLCALQRKSRLFSVLLFWELRGLSPNFHIRVSVNDLYIYSHDRSTYYLQQNRQIDCGNI